MLCRFIIRRDEQPSERRRQSRERGSGRGLSRTSDLSLVPFAIRTLFLIFNGGPENNLLSINEMSGAIREKLEEIKTAFKRLPVLPENENQTLQEMRNPFPEGQHQTISNYFESEWKTRNGEKWQAISALACKSLLCAHKLTKFPTRFSLLLTPTPAACPVSTPTTVVK